MNIDTQIKAVKDEIKRRERFYPKLIEKESMTDDYADLEILKMRAVLITLTQLRSIAK